MSHSAGFTSQDSATKISVGDAITPEDVSASSAVASDETARYALLLGDDCLILAQRLGHWISRAPSSKRTSRWGTSPWTFSATHDFSLPTLVPPGARPKTIWRIFAQRKSSVPAVSSSRRTVTSAGRSLASCCSVSTLMSSTSDW